MAGSALAGPSLLCRSVNWAGVSCAPAAFSGPATWVNSPLADSCGGAFTSGDGSSQTGWLNLKRSTVGLAEDCGKCLVSRAVPAAESLPAGGVVSPPNPPDT